MINLGIVARALGDRIRAATLLVDGLKIIRQIEDRDAAARCLEALAGLAGSEGNFERGALLFGAAAGLREAIGAPLPSVYCAAFDADLELVRRGLAHEHFAKVLATGRILGWERMVEDITSDAEASTTQQTLRLAESP
jgi:non-specific serine/threonine protein kinase